MYKRQVQAAALTRQLQEHGADLGVTPYTAVVLTVAAANLLFMESALGISLGHEDTQAFIERSLQKIESNVPPSKSAETSPALPLGTANSRSPGPVKVARRRGPKAVR